MLVADDNQGAEAEAAPPFHDLGGAIDVNHLLAQLVLALALARAIARFRRGPAPARAPTAAAAALFRIGSDYVSHVFSSFN